MLIILGMVEEVFFKFGLWPPLSGRHLHCKFGAIQIRATYAKNHKFVHSVFAYITVLHAPMFGPHDTLSCVLITLPHYCILRFLVYDTQFIQNVILFCCNAHLYPNKCKEKFVILQSIGIIAIKSSETRAVIYTCRYFSGQFNP